MKNRECRTCSIPTCSTGFSGLSERYALLTRQIEALQDSAAAYDRPVDLGQLANFEALRSKVRAEVVETLENALRELG